MEISLHTERLHLRLLESGDADVLEQLAGDKDLASTTLGIPHPYPKGSAAGFIAYRQEAASQGEGYSFAVLTKSEGTFLGVVGLHLDKNHNNGELGYWIGKPYWGKGYGSEAARRVVQFAFDEIKLNRVWAAAMTKNPGSSRIMEKAGMKHEGTFREHILKWDVYEDLSYYGLLRSEYRLSSK